MNSELFEVKKKQKNDGSVHVAVVGFSSLGECAQSNMLLEGISSWPVKFCLSVTYLPVTF